MALRPSNPTSIEWEENSITLPIDEIGTAILDYIPTDSEFIEGNLTISSTDSSVASIILNYAEEGIVDFSITPLAEGTCTVTASYATSSGTLTSSFDLEVITPEIEPTSIDWEENSITLTLNDVGTAILDYLPSNSEFNEGNLTISSTDDSIASISLNYAEEGIADFSITPLSAGTCTITATYETESDTLTSSFDLEVTLPEAENISWKYPQFYGVNSQEFINELIVEPANADISSINVRTSNTSVTITQDSENPKLYHFAFSATATGYGENTITATLGELTAIFKMKPEENTTFKWYTTGYNTWNTNTSTDFLILPEGADINDVVITSQLSGVLTVTQDSLNPTMFFIECNNATQRYFNQKITATLNEDSSEINVNIEWISDYSWNNSELSIVNGNSANNRPIGISGESSIETYRMTFTQNPEGFITITTPNSQNVTFAVSNLEEDTDITISGNLYGVIKTFTIHATTE